MILKTRLGVKRQTSRHFIQASRRFHDFTLCQRETNSDETFGSAGLDKTSIRARFYTIQLKKQEQFMLKLIKFSSKAALQKTEESFSSIFIHI